MHMNIFLYSPANWKTVFFFSPLLLKRKSQEQRYNCIALCFRVQKRDEQTQLTDDDDSSFSP